MIKVTTQAADQIRVAAEQAGVDIPALRLAAKKLDNGDIDYGMGFDEQREFDLEVVENGINFLIGPNSRDLLEGVTLDFVELEPGQFHFIFIPPKNETENGSNCGGGCAS